jgi:predicted TIM-barrel fold metal-dependent hydrolase
MPAAEFVVDADSHVLEPPDLWERYLEPRYRERAIRIVPGPGGTESLVADGEVLMPAGLAGLGGAEHDAPHVFATPTLKYLDTAPRASFDTAARLALMDAWGVDAGVVFPTIGILWDKERDPELAMAWARAYNNWQLDFVAPARERLWPIAHVPLYDAKLAREELERCLALGFRGMFVAPEPVLGRRPSHPDFDPIWALLQEAELPFCLHVIVRFNRSLGGVSQWYDREQGEFNAVFGFGLGGTYQLIPAISSIVCDGLFDRFPRLRAFVVEAGGGWAGYVMDRLDEKHARFGSQTMKRRPSDYFRENVWVACDTTERGIGATCELLGEEHVLWGSDYPHIDAHVAAPDEIRAALASLGERRRRLVLGENARKLFGAG